MYVKVGAGSLIITILFFLFGSQTLQGASPVSYSIPHVKQSIKLDGVLDEHAWDKALSVPLSYEVDPAENIPAPVKTTAFIFEDGETLFVAFEAEDPNPESIRAYLSERDDIWQSDYLGFTLDTFNDSRRGFQFLANALGIQSDSTIDEITEQQDFGWDSIWRSEGKVNSKGYIVEFAIPLKVLRFSDVVGEKQWGIQFFRILPRDVKHKLSNTPQNRNSNCQLCQFDTYEGLADTSSSNSIILIPSLTMNSNRQRGLQESKWDKNGIRDRESLDLRWAINSNTFVSATINPDFSEIETDAIQVETNQRFAIFVPEKRTFFTEGSDFFSNQSRLIHTKIFLEPEYGVKAIGKSGNHSYGLMRIEDKDTRFLIPGSQTSRLVTLEGTQSSNQILRYRYDIGEQGNIGLTYTDRDADNYSNRMLSLNGKYWFNDSDYFRFQLMTSDSKNPLEIQQDFDRKKNESGAAFSLNYTHASRNWSWLISHFYLGNEFRADSGFLNRSNLKTSGVQVIRKWYPEDQTKWWKKISLGGEWQKDSEIKGFGVSNEKVVELAIESSYQSEFGMSLLSSKERFLTEWFDLDVQEVFAAWTPYAGMDLNVSYSFGDQIDFSIVGDQIDFSTVKLGKQNTFQSNMNYQVNQNWKLSLEYINQSLKVDQEEGFELELFNVNTLYQFNRRNFFRITLQGQSQSGERALATQLLYKYKVNPFTLFYVGYSDQGFKTLETDQFKKVERRVFVKFSYAWQL